MGKSLKGKELGQGISQRKDGRYQARYTNRYGKRITLYAKTVTEIYKKLQNSQYEDSNLLNKDKGSSSITLNEWFDIWLQTYKRNCRQTSISNYTVAYKRIGNLIGHLKINDINLNILQESFNQIKSNESRKKSKKILVDMYNIAVVANIVDKNIAKNINAITSDESDNYEERRVMTVEETKLFLKYAKKQSMYYDLYCFALETGMRIGEIVGLRLSDVDLNKRMIEINQTCTLFTCRDKTSDKCNKLVMEFHSTKTKAGKRKIPMTQNVYEILNKRIENHTHKSEFIFTNSKGTVIYDTVLRRNIDIVVKHINNDGIDFKKISPHTFRHTFATRAIENGMNPKSLQKILGHANIGITMNLYCHVTDDTLISEMKKFENNIKYQDGVKMV